MPLLKYLRDIFLEENTSNCVVFSPPKDFTQHYTKELEEIYLDAIYVATTYTPLEEKIAGFKYFSQRQYGDLFGDLLSKTVDQFCPNIPADTIIVPVPMHWSRYIYRGFDHTFFLANLLSNKTGIPTKKSISTHWTRHQSKLNKEKRLENKKNTFTIKNHHQIAQNILLLDDVISTGSTANECAKVLKMNGAKMVIGIFLASNHFQE